MSFQEFLAWKLDTGRYELHDGVIVEMQPTGAHEQVVGLLQSETQRPHRSNSPPP